MPNRISLVGKIEEKYVIVTPRELLFDGDGPSFYEWFADTLEDARTRASRLTNAKIYLYELVEVKGFSGVLQRSKEVV